MIRCGLGEEPRLHAGRPIWKLSHSPDERKWGGEGLEQGGSHRGE